MKIRVEYTVDIEDEIVKGLCLEHGLNDRKDIKWWLECNGTGALEDIRPIYDSLTPE